MEVEGGRRWREEVEEVQGGPTGSSLHTSLGTLRQLLPATTCRLLAVTPGSCRLDTCLVTCLATCTPTCLLLLLLATCTPTCRLLLLLATTSKSSFS